ncbi:hypothetical protein ILUMI_24125 [Ignelater luminosus]|uniref:Integrase zinc-binding domain-containing protein n=1 Tax=Ignelater luminosus TaxID=2038154 RepID=A0A8K0G0Y8_IGNLU|nr:hypothetical protein ILUMI_24125 [Ignelater luminosus]
MESNPAIKSQGVFQDKNDESQVQLTLCNNNKGNTNVILPVVKIGIYSFDGQLFVVKGLLDSGSQLSFITDELYKKLKISSFPKSLSIFGITKQESKTQMAVHVKIYSCTSSYNTEILCSIMPEITNNLPTSYFDKNEISLPKNVNLSNPEFNIPDKISILLGADALGEILEPGSLIIPNSRAKLLNTKFGYVVIGNVNQDLHKTSNLATALIVTSNEVKLTKLINKFWEVERVPEIFSERSSEQQLCEETFRNSVRNIDNRFQVDLPLKQNLSDVCLDSRVVLSWLKLNPYKLNNYVANRVSKINELTQNFKWNYIESNQNPSDLISRGTTPKTLANSRLWWKGPEFLTQPHLSILMQSEIESLENIPEVKSYVATTKAEYLPVLTKFSNLQKLQRVIAYVLRFIHNTKNKREKLMRNLIAGELDNSLNMTIKLEQQKHFQEEIRALCKNEVIKTNLKYLHPFLDRNNILRITGRLQNAKEINYSQKHPIILPKRSHITNLIIQNEHKILMHAGQRHVLASLSQKFWIISAIREIKKNIHKCLTCFKLKAKTTEQLMGLLPVDIVNQFRPFLKTGMDFFGPFSVRHSGLKRAIVTKAYVLVQRQFI